MITRIYEWKALTTGELGERAAAAAAAARVVAGMVVVRERAVLAVSVTNV